MSNGLTDAAITSVLNHQFATGTYAKPAGHTLHLYTGDPHGAGLEVNVGTEDTAYLAQSITFEDEGTTTAGRLYNDALVTFAATVFGGAHTVTHWCVKDGGSVLMAAGAMPTPVPRLAGEPLAFAAGALYISLARTA